MDCRSWMVALAALVAPAIWSSAVFADCGCAPKKCQCVQPCPPNPCQPSPYYAQPGEGQPQAPAPPMGDMPMADDLTQPSDDLPAMPLPAATFAASTQFASASENIGFRNATIGDFFGNTARIAGPSFYNTAPQDGFNMPIGGGDRQYKISENVSPIPVDRWFVNYNHFSQPVQNATGSGQDVDRVTLGFEKTFLDGSSSFELRVPIVGGLSSSQDITGTGDQTDIEFGNMNLVFKSILLQNGNDSALTAGVTVNVPTAGDATVVNGLTNTTIVMIDNQSVHVLPFVAYYHQHSSRTWSTVIAQLDFDVNGTTFYDEDDGGRINFGRYQEQNFLYLDYSFGHWCYVAPYDSGFIRRFGVIGELHYSTSINDTDTAQAGPSSADVVTNPFNRIDVLNATGGIRFQLGDGYLLTAAAVAPLKDGENQLFDSEIAILLTKQF